MNTEQTNESIFTYKKINCLEKSNFLELKKGDMFKRILIGGNVVFSIMFLI